MLCSNPSRQNDGIPSLDRKRYAALFACAGLLCFMWFFGDSACGQEYLPAQNFSVPQTSLAPQTQMIPVKPLGLNFDNRIQLQSDRDTVTLVTRDAPLSTVLSMIAQQQNLNIVTGEEVSERINVTLKNVRLDDALNSILAVHGYTWARQNNIITVSSMTAERRTSPNVQGRIIRVFTLNYVLGSDVDKVVKGLMSPLGQSFINQTSKTEQRNAHEQLVVEDLPPYVDRIASYIAQIDTLPRQVVVESNVLQVTLKDNNRHGVNFKQLADMNNSQITLETSGLAAGTPPTSTMRVNSTDLTSLIELLKATNDTKTLASPKVAVLNGQEARISVGGKLGYLQTTATTTSTLQSVSFLDFGVVLKVVPIITEDGQILLTVSPQVSTGRINPTSKLPESESTEVETTVMLSDGQAIVIGGLIKETSSDNQNKIPFLGDLWVVGRLFQSRETLRERNEIIITLLPRIARPGDACWSAMDSQVAQASTPLMTRNLTPIDRTAWEGELPDSGRRSKKSWNWFRKPKKAIAPAVEVTGAAPIASDPAPPIEFDNSYYTQPIMNYPPSSPIVVPNNTMDYANPVPGTP